MASIKVYNLKGDAVEDLKLSDDIFNVAPKKALLHEVMVGFLSNKRGPYAHTKTKGEVRGGGKKPWKQKGTGRARHGSTRSPIWVGGGITFGPRSERNYKIKINKKVKDTALRMLLTDKLRNNGLVVVDKMELKEPKTKILLGAIKNLFSKIGREFTGRGLLVTDEKKDIKIASRNLKELKNVSSNLSILEVMNSNYLLLEKSAFEALVKRLSK